MNTKHNDHTCKICYKVFPKSMDALVHMATNHIKNIMEDISKIDVPTVKDMYYLRGPAKKTALHRMPSDFTL